MDAELDKADKEFAEHAAVCNTCRKGDHRVCIVGLELLKRFQRALNRSLLDRET